MAGARDDRRASWRHPSPLLRWRCAVLLRTSRPGCVGWGLPGLLLDRILQSHRSLRPCSQSAQKLGCIGSLEQRAEYLPFRQAQRGLGRAAHAAALGQRIQLCALAEHEVDQTVESSAGSVMHRPITLLVLGVEVVAELPRELERLESIVFSDGECVFDLGEERPHVAADCHERC